MPDKAAGLLDTALVWGGMIATWATGEAGRIYVSGAAGGMFRWFLSERRKLRDGAVAVIAGAISANYMSSITRAAIEMTVGSLGDGPDAERTAAFAAGLLGMTGANIIITILESQGRRIARASE